MLGSVMMRLIFVGMLLFVWNQAAAQFWAPVRENSYYGVRYITGGVGSDEQEYLKSSELRSQYTLEIVTASKGGSYVANADVSITDSGGESVLKARMNGPMLLALLDEGRYKVEVTVGSESQQREVSVKKGRLARVVTTWDVIAERLDKAEVSPANVHPVIPETIDGLEVTTVPSLQGEPGFSSDRQRRLEKARALREESIRLEMEARRIEESLR